MLALIQRPDVLALLAFVLGLCVGSFLNVVIHRLPRILERQWRLQCAELQGDQAPAAERYNLAIPRSRCPACGQTILAWQNIPLVSYFLLRGRCHNCRASISPRYPIIEVSTAFLLAYAAWRYGYSWQTLAVCFYLSCLIALTFIDIDTQLLPDTLTLPLLWGGLIVNALPGVGFASLSSAVWGAVAGYLSLWLVYWGFKLITGREGMGYGDFKLLGAIGAWLGWQLLPLVILFSSLVGALVGLVIILLRHQGKSVPIPFGPYLAAAGVLALFWGKPLLALYLGG